MSNKFGKTREIIDTLDKKSGEIARAKLKAQHRCSHNIDGDTNRCLTIIKTQNGAALKCEKCGKNNIVTTPPKASELKEAVSIVENAIDYIKIQQRESNPQEKEIVEKCADCLELMTAIAKMYENMEIHGNQKKKDRDRENRRTAFALTNRSILD